MNWTPLALPARSSPGRFGVEAASRLINCYAEALGPDGKSQIAAYVTEGLDTWKTVAADGGCKCLLATENYLYGVAGTKMFAIDASGTITILLTYSTAGPCYMARNRRNPTTQIGVVNSATAQYHYIENTTVTQVTDPDLAGTPGSIAFKDGYFVIPTNFGRYFITGEDNAATVAATDFGKAQRSPDEISRVLSSETDIMLLGSDSIEWHANQAAGDGLFPFVPVAQIELGVLGAQACCRLDRTIVFAASDGTVRLVSGYGAERISTHAVERAIGALSDPSTIVMWGVNAKSTGHSWIVMESDSWTWVYGLRTGEWHERRSYGLNRWRATQSVVWQGMTIVGDYATGELYQLSGSYYSDGGDPIVMEVHYPPLAAGPFPIEVHALHVDTLPGQGLVTGDAADTSPEMMLSWSDDGGKTFSPERQAEIGERGNTNARAKWTRLGMIRRNGRTFKVKVSASIARAVTGAQVATTVWRGANG
jgi:hypothetical protein